MRLQLSSDAVHDLVQLVQRELNLSILVLLSIRVEELRHISSYDAFTDVSEGAWVDKGLKTPHHIFGGQLHP